MAFILTGTDNDGFRHRYSIKKDRNFKKSFFDFMVSLGFEKDKLGRSFFIEDEEGKHIVLSEKDFEDEILHFSNKVYDVDLFFGTKKVIFVVRTKKRVPMVEHLENKADWISPLEAEEIRKEKSKRHNTRFEKGYVSVKNQNN